MAEINTPAISRRGVATARGTQRLKFTNDDADKRTGLFLAHLENVDVTTIKIGEDKQGMPSFNGLEVPKIRFMFASNHEVESKRKYITLSFTAVESNRDTIEGGKDAWKVEQVFNWIQHIIKVFACNGKELTEVFTDEQLNSLNLSYVDIDETGSYCPVEPEQVLASWKAIFDNVENILNRGKDGTPYYRKDNNFIPVWIKLIRCIKTKNKGWTNVNNGELSFPTFIGEGCIERVITNILPSIHIDIVRETIMPKVVDQPKTPSSLPNPGMMGGIPTGMDNMGAGMSIGSESGFTSPFGVPEDMPEF